MVDHSSSSDEAIGPNGAGLPPPDPRGWLVVYGERWFGGPPRVWQILLMAALCGFVVYATSFPRGLSQLPISVAGLLLRPCCVWPGGIILLGLDYVIRTAACAGTSRFSARDWRWYMAGALLVATIAAWRTEPLLRWRFSANRPALERTVVTLLQTTPTASGGEGDEGVNWPFCRFDWYRGEPVGDYNVTEVAVFQEERVVYLTTGGFFRAGWGFLYDPDAKVNTSYIRLSPLGDGWYVFAYAKE